MAKQKEIFETIANNFISMIQDAIDSGKPNSWLKPWKGTDLATSLSSFKPYGLMNQFLLSFEAARKGYASPYWGTFNQVKKLGGFVKKGEKSSNVYLWKPLQIEEERENKKSGETELVKKTIFMMRCFKVFNLDQTEGVTHARIETEKQLADFEPMMAAEALVAGFADSPSIKFGGGRACYIPALDEVHMPKPEQFVSAEEYYSTMYHELVHSTGHKSRLSRKEVTNGASFGSETYAMEELVAELGSAYLCAMAGIECESTTANSAEYLRGWIKKLQEEPKIIAYAASRAEKAARYIAGDSEEAKESKAA